MLLHNDFLSFWIITCTSSLFDDLSLFVVTFDELLSDTSYYPVCLTSFVSRVISRVLQQRVRVNRNAISRRGRK